MWIICGDRRFRDQMISLSKNWLGLCNEALALCNKDQIQNLSEGTSQALACSTMLPGIVSRVLYERDWRCARKRTRISPDITAPEFGFAYRYPLPDDFLRPVDVGTDSWEIEAGCILADVMPLDLIYTAYPSGPELLNAELRSAIVYFLASEIAMALTSDSSLMASFRSMAETELQRAKLNESAGEKDMMPSYNSWGRD